MGNSETQKRVYFLGAGASKASEFELPTMSEFFLEEDLTRKEYENLNNFIKKVFPNANIRGLNLEDVITRLELSMDKFGTFGEHFEPYLLEARREFSLYVHERLTYEPKDGRRWCDKHKVLLEYIIEQDSNSIITLNYDLVIDHTLYKISPKDEEGDSKGELRGGLLYEMYGLVGSFKLGSPSEPYSASFGHYLKLHGSINWFYCANSTCRNHQLFFPNELVSEEVRNYRKDYSRNHYTWVDNRALRRYELYEQPINSGDLCEFCGSPVVSVIIPPTMNKTFDEYPKLGLLWSLAYREIRDADELVLIGMSLPDSDYYLKWLINAAISSREDKPLNVVVVNKIVDKEGKEDKKKVNCYKNKIKNLTGVLPEYWNDFCKYVDEIKAK